MKNEKKLKDSKPISIIIPVYNVFSWLDQCMESVINQTFTEFEVILINDGSTDGSDTKCQEWTQKDSRIWMISKNNEGPSTARNCGIQSASGEYLVFIDADDWIEPRFLEKLYNAINKYNVSMSECDIYRFNNKTGEKTYHVCSGTMGLPYTLEQHIIYGNTAIWKCMIKKSLFTHYGITFPNCHGEAKAIYALLIALSGQIVNVHEGLYYYRRFRDGSLTEKPRKNTEDENAIGLQAAEHLLQGFKACGLYSKYEDILQKSIKIGLSDRLAGLLYRREKKEFTQLTEEYYSYIGRRFPESANFRYITLGGYNLNRILRHINLLHNPYGRFNFSSIISLMHPTMESLSFIHKNKYREIMVQRDITSSFWNIIKEVKPEYIFLDLIEERFDILEYGGGYITKSDAFDGGQIENVNYRVIERDSEECLKLWKNCFQNFMKRIKISQPKCKIVLIENYLSEEVGDINEKIYFKTIDKIRNRNKILKQYYEFIKKSFKQILKVEAFKCNYYYTDKQYEYGAIPSHLNEIVNQEIAEKIESEIDI